MPATAQVFDGAWIGPGVELAAGVVVGPGAVLGFDHPDNEGGPVKVGEDTYIGPAVHIKPGVEIGPQVTIESGTTVGSGSRIGKEVYVGPNCLIAGNCQIDDDVHLSCDILVCRTARLHSHCQLMPGVKLLEDPCPPIAMNSRGPVIGECAVVGVNAIIWSGVQLGYHVIVAAASVVKEDVADYMLVRGSPAKVVCDVRRIQIKLGDKWVYPYPWMRHFVEGEDITKPAL